MFQLFNSERLAIIDGRSVQHSWSYRIHFCRHLRNGRALNFLMKDKADNKIIEIVASDRNPQ